MAATDRAAAGRAAGYGVIGSGLVAGSWNLATMEFDRDPSFGQSEIDTSEHA